MDPALIQSLTLSGLLDSVSQLNPDSSEETYQMLEESIRHQANRLDCIYRVFTQKRYERDAHIKAVKEGQKP